MRRKVKLYFLFLLLITLLFACSRSSDGSGENDGVIEGDGDPHGKYEEPITLEIAYYTPANISFPEGSDDTLSDNRYTRLFEDRLNLRFEPAFEVPNSDYTEKLNVLIGGNDIPDFTFVNERQFKLLAESDVLEDLTEIYDEYASPLLKEVIDGFGDDFINRVTFDDKLLGIPSTVPAHDSDGVLWLRTDWLENVGIDLPQEVTLDDLEKVARAFIDEDPDQNGEDDTFGIQSTSSFVTGTMGYNSLDLVFTAHHSFPKIWQRDENDEIIYGSITEETKNALETLNKWYEDGLIDKEFGTIRPEQFERDISAGKAGISMGFTWAPMTALANSVANDPSAVWDAHILVADDGKYYARQPNPMGRIMVVKKGAKNPEAIIKAINLTTEDFDNTVITGGEGPYSDSPGTNWTIRPIQATFRTIDTVKDRFQRFADAAEGKITKEDLPAGDVEIYENYTKGFDALKESPQDWAYTVYQYKGGSTVLNPVNERVYNAYYGLTDTMELKWANLEKLEEEAFIRMITGEEPLDYFDTFVSEWKKQGGEEITKEVEKEIELLQ